MPTASIHVLTELLAQSYLENVEVIGIESEGVDLSSRELQSCAFRNVRLPASRWRGVVLEDCTFEGCDFGNVQWQGATLRDVRFSDCKLLGTQWVGVGPSPDVRFASCDMRYLVMASLTLRKTSFRDCILREASFVEVDLTECDFAGCDLTGTTFERCTLRGADMSQATGAFVDPAKNLVRDLGISEETAIAIARHLGMKLGGESARRSKTPRKR